MRYELINTTLSPDTNVFDVTNNEDGSVTETPTTRYACAITMTFKDTESQNEGTFDKTIIVESDNKETGFEVDSAREKAVQEYLNNLNA